MTNKKKYEPTFDITMIDDSSLDRKYTIEPKKTEQSTQSEKTDEDR